MDELFLMKIHDYSTSAYQSQIAYLAETQTDKVSGEIYISDPRIYAVKRNDPDMPNFKEAVRGEFEEQYLEAMKKERLSFEAMQLLYLSQHGLQTQETN